ncbi:glutamate racemase [Thalassotalea sp. G2M2-11]|uniref:glutamate racemase n=1 Tax=Thalassotalea sp. G2M2-11 TaxID=2787627 RepID=UPI0019D0BF3C|nr:glutamate racemase [Thalassotalea sp. G2M2-11]
MTLTRPQSLPPALTPSQAIGVFDSGLGGLTITKQIVTHLPNEHLIYVADSAYAPYGELTTAQIHQRANTISHWLVKQGCKAIVIACNTATVNVIEQLRARFSLPIIGVEPAIKPASQISNNKKVAILVTQATARNSNFLSLVEQHKNDSEVVIQPCPGLVELIEQGEMASPKCQQLLAHYLQPLLKQNIDTLVLGCTHYPFVSDLIKKLLGDKVALVETSTPVTLQLIKQLEKFHLLNDNSTSGQQQFYSSLANEVQQQLFIKLWGKQLELVSFHP